MTMRNSQKGTSRYASLASSLMESAQVEKRYFDESTFETVWLHARRASLFRAILNEFVKKNVKVASANGWPQTATTVQDAVETLAKDIRSSTASTSSPSWIFVGCSETLDPEEVLDAVQLAFPKTENIHCITSCQGVTTDAGFKSTSCSDGVTRAVSLFAVLDPLGTFQTLGTVPPEHATDNTFINTLDQAYLKLRSSALAVLKDPLLNGSSVPGPEPLAEHINIWMSGLPGVEEKTLEGLYEWSHMRFNRTIPVVGGSGADAGIEGKWRTFCRQGDGQRIVFGQEKGNGVVLTMIAASVKVFPCFMHPFTPMTKFTAQVVSCGMAPEENKGETVGRVIHTFRDPDGNEVPAGSLYHQWCEEQVQKKLMPPPKVADGPGAFNPEVLAASTACPLGVPVAREGDDAFDYRMMHPSGIYFKEGHEKTKDAAYLKNFASVETGKTDVVLFKARRGDLLSRLSKLKEQLVRQIDRTNSATAASVALSSDALNARLSGVLMVYCAGCMLAVNSGKDGAEQMRRLTSLLSSCFAGRPFLAYHPFGEQGFFPSKQVNHHSNLMFSALCFSKDPCFEIDEGQAFSDVIAEIIGNFTFCDATGQLSLELQDLIASGDQAHWSNIAHYVHSGMITPQLLEDMTTCLSQPLTFALRGAKMFHDMSKKYPLVAREYRQNSQWFKDFCSSFMAVAPMHLLAKGNVLDYQTILLAVEMAVKVDVKGMVAAKHFQELMEEIWMESPEPEEAMRRLVSGAERKTMFKSPMARYYRNLFSYCVLTWLQFYTTHYATDSTALWGLILLWSTSNFMQSMASPSTGFLTWLTTLDDLAIVFAHSSIWWQVYNGRDTPRDLDAVTMILHFANIIKAVSVQPELGSWVIMVTTIMGDVQQFLVLLLFFIICVYASIHALFRDVKGVYTGSNWEGATTLLINAIWGPQVLWNSQHDDNNSLFLSWVFGHPDSWAIDTTAGIIMAFVVFIGPIVLLNLLIATMAATYDDVSANVDVAYKCSFASCVLAARELPLLPMPLSLPFDVVRIFMKLRRLCQRDGQGSMWGARTSMVVDKADSSSMRATRQVVMSQILALLESHSSLKRFKEAVTVEQMERMRTQSEGLEDRVNLLYNTILNMSEKQGKMEANLAALTKFTKA